jgi:hypothetical protein
MKSRKLILKVLLSVALIIMVLNLSCTIAAGGRHTVGIRPDGTVVATGNNDDGQCNVAGWTDIVHVAAGFSHTVGLEEGGTVVATGNNDDGQCNVAGWTDISMVVAGYAHTVGLKSDGTVVATGNNAEGQCNVAGWTDIQQVAAGRAHTVGLKSDGTVVATGRNNEGQCKVSGWTNIVQVAAGGWHTVGLKDCGTVVATGNNDEGQCDVGSWILETLSSEPPGSYHLTISSAAGGLVTAPGEGTFAYCESEAVNLVAEADACYEFVDWTGDVGTIGNVNAASTNITMDGDYFITANFAKISYDLTTDSTAGGSVTTPGEGTFPYDCGTVVNLVAEAEEGYRFVNWTGDIATIADAENATTTITMNDNYSVTANFEEKPSIINWPLIAGIIGAVVVVGLVIFFVRRR